MAQDFAAFTKKIDGVVKEFDGTAGTQRLKRVAMQTKKDVDEAVRHDLGDQSMSGWRRGNPIDIGGRFDLKSDHEIEMLPSKKAGGPMRVLEQGRNQGNAGGLAGPGISKDGTTKRTKAGKVAKVRARKGHRWNGRTQGKGTWSDAVKLMEQRVPGRVDDEVRKALAKHLGKG